jgi:hypothetical protein
MARETRVRIVDVEVMDHAIVGPRLACRSSYVTDGSRQQQSETGEILHTEHCVGFVLRTNTAQKSTNFFVGIKLDT